MAATPVLWRVMSADQTDSAKAILLAHHVLDAMAYQQSARPAENQNVWVGSNLQIWLNSETGFLADFSTRERFRRDADDG